MKCISCGKKLNRLEYEIYSNGETCCSGYMCGCMGMPIDPPYCKECLGESLYKECRHKCHMDNLGRRKMKHSRAYFKAMIKENGLSGIRWWDNG